MMGAKGHNNHLLVQKENDMCMHTYKSKFHEHVLIFTEEDILLLFLFYFAFEKNTGHSPVQ